MTPDTPPNPPEPAPKLDPNTTLTAIEKTEEFPRLDRLGEQNPVARMVDEIVRIERVPYEMAAVACLGAVSAACGSGIELAGFSGRQSRGNLYLVVGAESTTGKSVVWRHAFAPLHAMEKFLLDRWKHDIQPQGKAKKRVLEQNIKRAEKEGDENELIRLERKLKQNEADLIPPQLIIEDATAEALQRSLADAGEVLTLVSSDGRSVVKNILGRYNQANQPEDDFFVKAWSGDPTKVHRIRREPTILDSPCLALCVAVQPDKLESLFATQALAESGFIQRILPAPTSAKIQDIVDSCEGIDSGVEACYSAHLEQIMECFLTRKENTGEEPQLLEMSDEAKYLFQQRLQDWTDLARGPLSDIAPFVVRWRENALRIAVVLHVARHSSEAKHHRQISIEVAHLATDIQLWFASRQLRLLGESRERMIENKRETLAAILDGCLGRERSLAELKNRNGKDEEFVRKVVSRFPDEFEIIETPAGPQGGRPSRVVRMKRLE